MSIKARIEAIIYATEEPVVFNQLYTLVKDQAREELLRRRAQAVEAAAEAADLLAEPPAEAAAEALAVVSEALPDAAPEVVAEAAMEIAPEAAPEAAPNAPSVEDEAAAESAAPAEIDAADESAAPAEAVATSDSTPDALTEVELRTYVRGKIDELIADYNSAERGIEIRQIAGGYRMATKPEQHDAVRMFAKSLKPPIKLSLQALETLAVVAYKQPITSPEISEVRGVDTGGVLATLLDRKLITTAGRKQVIGRPILYKTTREFLLRFGLKDVNELPSMEEFEKLAAESLGTDLFTGQPVEPPPPPAPDTSALEDAEDNNQQADAAEIARPAAVEAPAAVAPAETTQADEPAEIPAPTAEVISPAGPHHSPPEEAPASSPEAGSHES